MTPALTYGRFHPDWSPGLGNFGVGSLGGDSDDDEQSRGSMFGSGLVSGAKVGATTAVMTGSNVAGAIAGGLALAGSIPSPAAPFLLAAAALVGPIASLFKGCGQTCVQATQIINDATAAANKIRDTYLAQPVRTKSMQAGALKYLNQLADYVRQACGSPALGAAGQRCVHEDLDRGAKSAWCPQGGCGWPELIFDPVANDPGVVPDPVDPVTQALSLTNPDGSMNYKPLILGAIGVVILLAVVSS